MTDTNEGNVCRGCYDYCFKCSSRQHPKGMAAHEICNSCAENMNRCEACENYIDNDDTVSCVECGVPYCDWCSDQPENMTRTEDDEDPICRDCAPVKSAETFNADVDLSNCTFCKKICGEPFYMVDGRYAWEKVPACVSCKNKLPDEVWKMLNPVKYGAETFGAEKIHGDERLDRWVENNYGDEYDWAFLNEYGEYDEWDDAYDILEDFIVLDDDGNEHKGIAIIHRKEYDDENFEAPYAGSGSLFSVGSSDSLSGLSSKELTESSAIHGDFDSASLNYSGHQNLQVRAEAQIDYQHCDSCQEVRSIDDFSLSKDSKHTLTEGEVCDYCFGDFYDAETFESMSWYDPGEDTNNLERAFRREYPRYTLDSGSMEYLIYQGGASNKFHIFFVAQDDGGQYHAFNAYGRIGYNPRIQYIGGPYSTKASAEYAFGKKMGQKTKKGYRPFGAEGSGDICTVCGDTAVHFYKDGEVILCDKHYQQQYGKYSAEELSVKEPFQTGFKLTLGVISAGVVGTLGLGALGMILTGLRNGDE
jgi:predicted DNA-binding WGR domain protein